MRLLKKDESPLDAFGVNRKRRFEEVINKSSFSNVWNSVKRYRFDILDCQLLGTAPEISYPVVLETDAFSKMRKLKLLQLYHVHMSGSFGKFPKGLRWLCWHGFHFKSIPSDFPLESVVALDMRYSNLINVFAGTKFLEVLKILDLSHSHNLANTPNFSKLPNLERLILKDCARLFEVHESIGYLERLVLLNLKDCKNMRKLPRSIGMLKSLETLDISGCSNLEEFPKQIGNLQSLTVLNVDGITINQPLSTCGEVKAWHSFMQPLLLKLRKTPEISWAALPRSLAKLSLANCNLSEDAFPKDLSNLSSLQFLNLSHNPIRSLPDFIRGLTGLKSLSLESCTSLQSLIGLPKIDYLSIGENTLLEKITYLSNSLDLDILNINKTEYDNLVEVMGLFKLEPIEKVDVEIVNNLGLSNFRTPGIPTVKLYSFFTHSLLRKLPLQGCHEEHIFCVYLPGSKVPPWFSVTNIGSSISFAVPSLLQYRIQGLCVCSVYEFCNDHNHAVYDCKPHTIISNTTKSLVWSHWPWHFGIPEADENMIWLSYWKFENQLEGGDELNVSVVGEKGFQVKEVGVRIVYKEDQEEKCVQIQSTSEAAASQQITLYGNVVPGTVSPRPARLNFYRIGGHYKNCRYCPLSYCRPWILDDPKSQ